jgi:hypothetical protein
MSRAALGSRQRLTSDKKRTNQMALLQDISYDILYHGTRFGYHFAFRRPHSRERTTRMVVLL